jgi:hypothetical protein
MVVCSSLGADGEPCERSFSCLTYRARVLVLGEKSVTMPRISFSIRDVFWLTLVVGMGVAWWLHCLN